MRTTEAPEHLRLFLAIALPDQVRAELSRAQQELRQATPELKARWTKPEQFHLTLRFLGNVASGQLELLTGRLRQVCQDFAPLELAAQGLGSFPDWRFPHVIWAGVRERQQALVRLHGALEQAVGPFSQEAREENFAGHVTLARIKLIRRPQADALARLGASLGGRHFGQWRAAQVDLLRSELGPDGARHSLVAGLALEGKPGAG